MVGKRRVATFLSVVVVALAAPAAAAPPTVSAGRATIRIDGRLDEAIYGSTEPIGPFVQQEPDEGRPATEKPEAWVLFDDDAIYVAARCWESRPDRRIANEMRRDSNQLRQNDTFAVLFDTFHDRRNGYIFTANAIGGLGDSQVTDEGPPNVDWNTVWKVETGRFDGGWTIEMAIPFKSLRYPRGRDQTWGINLRRVVGWKNEWSYLAQVPRALTTFRRHLESVVGRNAHRCAGAVGHTRDRIEAIRVVRRDDPNNRAGAVVDRQHQPDRRRREIRRHAEPDRRRDDQHRLRTS
jgi:Carbohydrate family 9 binding domain-like